METLIPLLRIGENPAFVAWADSEPAVPDDFAAASAVCDIEAWSHSHVTVYGNGGSRPEITAAAIKLKYMGYFNSLLLPVDATTDKESFTLGDVAAALLVLTGMPVTFWKALAYQCTVDSECFPHPPHPYLFRCPTSVRHLSLLIVLGADTQASPAQLFSRSQLLVALLGHAQTPHSALYTLCVPISPLAW